MKKIWNMATTLIIVILAGIAITLVGVRITGLQVFSVLSGSMEPTYKTGSLIYVREVEESNLNEGQAITFLADEKTVVTHRIVEVIRDEEATGNDRYRTKGDANDVADGTLVHSKNVIGVPVFSVPYMGYAANFIQKPIGKCILAVLSTGVLLSVISRELPQIRRKV